MSFLNSDYEITTISGTAKSSLINFALSSWPTYEIVTIIFACFKINPYICIMSCLHPIEIVNAAGKLLKVPCGKCCACLNKKRFDNQTKVDLHMQKHKYNLFFTATYSDKYQCFPLFLDGIFLFQNNPFVLSFSYHLFS